MTHSLAKGGLMYLLDALHIARDHIGMVSTDPFCQATD